ADQCRQDPEACKQALEQMGADLPQATRDARQSSSRDQLGRTLQQLRERLRRQNPAESGGRADEESFERAAGGVQPMAAGDSGGDAENGQGARGSAPMAAPPSGNPQAA